MEWDFKSVFQFVYRPEVYVEEGTNWSSIMIGEEVKKNMV